MNTESEFKLKKVARGSSSEESLDCEIESTIRLSLRSKEGRAAAARIAKGLSSEVRLAILDALWEKPMTLVELARALGLANQSALFHLHLLTETGLVQVKYLPSKKGSTQVFYDNFTSFSVDFSQQPPNDLLIATQSVHIGSYIDASADRDFSLLLPGRRFLSLAADDLMNAVKEDAILLCTTGGFVTYAFSNAFSKWEVRELRISLEICSETEFYRNDWKSDVTFFANGKELCTWTCPGDYGGVHGAHTPEWWPDQNTQFGDLVTIAVNENGTFLNNVKAGDRTLSDLRLSEGNRLLFRFGIKKDAEHYGGFNLFGKQCGNYAQEIELTAVCKKHD